MSKSGDFQEQPAKKPSKKPRPVADDADPPSIKKKSMSAKETYNTVTDTVTGANVRWKDNLVQALGMVPFVICGPILGIWLTEDLVIGGLLGLVGGLIAGFIVTGSLLMIYRTIMHARGRHD